MAKRQKDAATIARKWANNLSQSADAMTQGIRAVTQNPAQAAKAKKNTMKARLMKSLEDGGKYDQAMDQVTLQDWQDAAIKKGVARATQGAVEAEGKMQQFMSQLLPFTAQVSAKISQMPNATEAERDARMLAAVREMRAFRRNRR